MKVRVGKKIEVSDILEFYEMQEKKVEKKAEKQETPVVEEPIVEETAEE